MCPHPALQPVIHRPDIQIDGLDAAKRTLHQRQGFVATAMLQSLALTAVSSLTFTDLTISFPVSLSKISRDLLGVSTGVFLLALPMPVAM
jgi:hypothetical protein